jgi:enoyl-CoA hydratase
MDGIVMGGGSGIWAHGSLRLVTERSRVAIPKAAIGLSPDVGSMFLPLGAPGEIGTHLGMTGLSVRGWDAVGAGLAYALIASEDILGIIACLAAGESLDAGVAAPRLWATLPPRGAGSTPATPGTIPSPSCRP